MCMFQVSSRLLVIDNEDQKGTWMASNKCIMHETKSWCALLLCPSIDTPTTMEPPHHQEMQLSAHDEADDILIVHFVDWLENIKKRGIEGIGGGGWWYMMGDNDERDQSDSSTIKLFDCWAAWPPEPLDHWNAVGSQMHFLGMLCWASIFRLNIRSKTPAEFSISFFIVVTYFSQCQLFCICKSKPRPSPSSIGVSNRFFV